MQLYTCVYNPIKRAETRGDVIHPVTISVAGSTPEDAGLHLEVIFTDVRIRVSPDTIELLNRVLATMSGGSTAEERIVKQLEDYNSLWDFNPHTDNDFWFLKTDLAEDVLEVASEGTLDTNVSEITLIKKNELCFMTIPSLVLTIEAGVGNKTLPMLLLESSFQGNVNNWSSEISIDTSLTLQMGYYNSKLALWEPLLEPVEVIESGKSTYVPWEIKLEVAMNEQEEQQTTRSPTTENFECVDINTQPSMSINVSSVNNLELTVTKTCLDVLNNLGKAFANAMKSSEMKQIKASAAFVVQNDTGIPITLCLHKSTFVVQDAEDSMEVILESAAEVPLALKASAKSQQTLRLGKEISRTKVEIAEHLLYIKVG